MAEHDSDREDREPDEQGVPFDEEAAWAAIVAGYGEEPKDPPGTKPFKSVEDLALLETETNDEPTTTETQPKKDGAKKDAPKPDENPAKPLGGSVAFAPGVGPRDYSAPEPSEEDFEEDDEGHFVPRSRRRCHPPTPPRGSPGWECWAGRFCCWSRCCSAGR